MEKVPDNFLGIEPELSNFEKSRVVVASAPYEKTVTYGKGTSKGPRAIIEASKQLEFWDEELKANIVEKIGGVATLKPYDKKNKKPEEVAQILERETKKLIERKKFVVTLGGEHSMCIGPARAYSKSFQNISILYFDAHGDLRNEYMGSEYNHACALRRIADVNGNIVHIGCRSLEEEQMGFIEKNKLKFFWAHEFKRGLVNYEGIINSLKENVYISFDIDVLDSGLHPSTSNPEPGGLDWYDMITVLRNVGKEKNIVGFDICEHSPIKNFYAYDFTAAKLAYKTIGYALLKT
ncbi:TPA: agmatinase [archaeon]|nr:agmatinase [Candidatus Naiadarchaeales archaeon SRR2090153.bin1042]